MPAAPCLCGHCPNEIVYFLQQYEWSLEERARGKFRRRKYLSYAQLQYAARHIRHLRQFLAEQPSRIVEIAQEMFDAEIIGCNTLDQQHEEQ